MNTTTLQITGMTCDRCALTVDSALNAVSGVNARVSYEESLARVESKGQVDTARRVWAVKSKGYGAARVKGERRAGRRRGALQFHAPLVIVFGVLGVSAWLGWIDYVLFPALALFLAFTSYALYAGARKPKSTDKTAEAS